MDYNGFTGIGLVDSIPGMSISLDEIERKVGYDASYSNMGSIPDQSSQPCREALQYYFGNHVNTKCRK